VPNIITVASPNNKRIAQRRRMSREESFGRFERGWDEM
jgi:hypothetical protein